jgi:hypothetical protein
MTPDKTEIGEENRSRSTAWFLAAIGASIGIAALAYRSKPRNPWQRASDRAGDLLQTARKEMKPWMGAAAGTAAAATALGLYMRKPRESAWQRTGRRAAEMASRIGAQATGPWGNFATAAAVGLLSMAYANQARRRTIRGIDASTAGKINAVREKGLRALRVVRDISQQAGKRYTSLRRTVA